MGPLQARQPEGAGTSRPVVAGQNGPEQARAAVPPTRTSLPPSQCAESQPPSQRPQRQRRNRFVGRRARRGAAVKVVEDADRFVSRCLCVRVHRCPLCVVFRVVLRIECVGNDRLFIIQWTAQRQNNRLSHAWVPDIQLPAGALGGHRKSCRAVLEQDESNDESDLYL